MLKLLNCPCGSKPKFGKTKLWSSSKDYFSLTCSKKDCKFGISTFGTAKKEYCAELWNAAIKYRSRCNK